MDGVEASISVEEHRGQVGLGRVFGVCRFREYYADFGVCSLGNGERAKKLLLVEGRATKLNAEVKIEESSLSFEDIELKELQ